MNYEPQTFLGMAGVGFFGMLLIGFLAGWIAERVMNRDHGLLTNILVGIAGSFVGGTAAGLLGFSWYGFTGNLVVATLGAIAILWFFGRQQQSLHKQERRPRQEAPKREGPPQQGPWQDTAANSGESRPGDTPIYHTRDERKG